MQSCENAYGFRLAAAFEGEEGSDAGARGEQSIGEGSSQSKAGCREVATAGEGVGTAGVAIAATEGLACLLAALWGFVSEVCSTGAA